MTTLLPQTFQNAILKNVARDCIERLRLKAVKLEMDRRIAGPDDRRIWLYFIESGSVALSVPLRDGSEIDAGILGNRSMVGATALLGVRESLYQATVRSPGHAFVCSVEHGLSEFARAGKFHDLALACLHDQIMQSSQIAACNGRHDVEQRLCRWMLHSLHVSSTQHIQITHEHLADALGVRRTTVTIIMHRLRLQGFIHYQRGCIHILDRAALESRTCECYQALRGMTGATRSASTLGRQSQPQLMSDSQYQTPASSYGRSAEPRGSDIAELQ